MFIVFLLTVVSHLGSALVAAPKPEPIKVVSIKASSTMPKWKGYTFDATNLIDGRVDTSWQPKKSDTLGVGQWVEIDLGEPHAIDRIEIAQGLQKVDPKLGDLFCRNNRLATGDIWFDDGTYAPLWIAPSNPLAEVTLFYRGEALPDKEVTVITRYLRLVVSQVHEPVDWSDLAIAEIRVFGRPTAARPVDPKILAWDQPGLWPLRIAISDHCAVNGKTRKVRDCWHLINAISTGYGEGYRSLTPIAAEDFAKGKVVTTIHAEDSRHHIEFQRATDGRWAVKRHTRTDATGKPAPLGYEGYTEDPKVQWQNECWDKLGKTRPVVLNPPEELQIDPSDYEFEDSE